MQAARSDRATTEPKDVMVYPVATASLPVNAPLPEPPGKLAAFRWSTSLAYFIWRRKDDQVEHHAAGPQRVRPDAGLHHLVALI